MENREAEIYFACRTRDDVRSHNFAYTPTRCSAGINRTSNGADFAAYYGCNQARIDLFPTDQTHVGRLDHRIRGLDHRDQSPAFNHAKCFFHSDTFR
jgi:hypothetical protein